MTTKTLTATLAVLATSATWVYASNDNPYRSTTDPKSVSAQHKDSVTEVMAPSSFETPPPIGGPVPTATPLPTTTPGPTPTPTPTGVVVNISGPDEYESGVPYSITWTTQNATDCEASGNGWNIFYFNTARPTAGNESFTDNSGDQTFTLSCTGPDGTGTGTWVVRLGTFTSTTPTPTPTPTPPALDFRMSRNTTTTNSSVTAYWDAENVDDCSVASSGGYGVGGSFRWNSASIGISGTRSLGPFSTNGTYSYTMTCTGSNGDIVETEQVFVSTSGGSGGGGGTGPTCSTQANLGLDCEHLGTIYHEDSNCSSGFKYRSVHGPQCQYDDGNGNISYTYCSSPSNIQFYCGGSASPQGDVYWAQCTNGSWAAGYYTSNNLPSSCN